MLAPLSVVGAALHIAAHAFGKITLFFAAGAIYTAAHKTEVSQLDGIGRRMPWTMAAFTSARCR
jgi:multicomponent Na+:H+ antiporter subunit D